MSRSSALIALGILVVLVPFSGLPLAFRTFLTVVFGLTVFGVGLALRFKAVKEARTEKSTEATPPQISAI